MCLDFVNLFPAPHFPGTNAVIYGTAANTLHLWGVMNFSNGFCGNLICPNYEAFYNDN